MCLGDTYKGAVLYMYTKFNEVVFQKVFFFF